MQSVTATTHWNETCSYRTYWHTTFPYTLVTFYEKSYGAIDAGPRGVSALVSTNVVHSIPRVSSYTPCSRCLPAYVTMSRFLWAMPFAQLTCSTTTLTCDVILGSSMTNHLSVTAPWRRSPETSKHFDTGYLLEGPTSSSWMDQLHTPTAWRTA